MGRYPTPIALLLRIILSSTQVDDWIFDPFAGTGTTLCVARQLNRNSIGIEIDPQNAALIHSHLDEIREADSVQKYYHDYNCTENLSKIWGGSSTAPVPKKHASSGQVGLFDL